MKEADKAKVGIGSGGAKPGNQAPEGLGKQITKGGAWMVGSRLVIRAIGFVSTLILARLLLPEDFGLIALATSFIGMLEVFAQFSFDLALIRDQKSGKAEYDTVWSLQVIKGVALSALVGAFAWPAADFFETPALAHVLWALALGSLVSGFINVAVVDFRKNLTFHKEFQLLLVPKLVSFLVTIGLALSYQSYWALVAGILAGSATKMAVSYVMHPFRPSWSLEKWREIVHFSKWLLFNNGIIFFASRSDTFVIGKILGPQSLGLYTVAYEISNLATSELIWPLMRAVYPGFAKTNQDPETFKKIFLRLLALVGLFALPVAAGIALTADLFVPILLGEKWLPIVPLIQILGAFGALRSVGTIVGPAMVALGRPEVITWVALASLSLMVPSLIFGVSSWGTLGAAWALVMVVGLTVVANLTVAKIFLKLSVWDLVSVLWRPSISTAVMIATVALYKASAQGLAFLSNPAVDLVLTITIGVATFLASCLVLFRRAGSPEGAESDILNILRSRRDLSF